MRQNTPKCNPFIDYSVSYRVWLKRVAFLI